MLKSLLLAAFVSLPAFAASQSITLPRDAQQIRLHAFQPVRGSQKLELRIGYRSPSNLRRETPNNPSLMTDWHTASLYFPESILNDAELREVRSFSFRDMAHLKLATRVFELSSWKTDAGVRVRASTK